MRTPPTVRASGSGRDGAASWSSGEPVGRRPSLPACRPPRRSPRLSACPVGGIGAVVTFRTAPGRTRACVRAPSRADREGAVESKFLGGRRAASDGPSAPRPSPPGWTGWPPWSARSSPRGWCLGHPLIEVVLGEPVPAVPEALRPSSQIDGVSGPPRPRSIRMPPAPGPAPREGPGSRSRAHSRTPRTWYAGQIAPQRRQTEVVPQCGALVVEYETSRAS